MKKVVLLLVLIIPIVMSAQDVVGQWKTIDDETGEARSVVEIYKKDGKVYGRVVELLNKEDKGNLCAECSGENKNKPIEGMVILKDLSKDGSEYNNGTILDPSNGKNYKCYITLEGANKLKVRGYIGISLMGRTQYWYRVQ